MPFIGNKPSAVPLTSADIADSIITSAKIVDATIANADIANSTINLTTKVTGTLPVANGGTGLAAIGSSLQVLRTNTAATALEYATLSTGAAAGQVIQVLSTTISGSNLTTTSTYPNFVAISGLSVSITPSSASNKILVLCTIQTSPEYNTSLTVYRGSTNLGGTYGFFYGGYYGGLNCGVSYLDSPATTSSTTYQAYWYVDGGTVTFYGTQKKATITVMEIKG